MTPNKMKMIVGQIAKALDELTVPTTPPRSLTAVEKYTYGGAILRAIIERDTLEIP